MFVIGEPGVVDDTYWYRIAVVSGEYSGAEECASYYSCINTIGHVGSPIDGEPWLVEAEVVCPSSPMAATDLAALHPLEQLHCYAGRDLEVTGMLDTPCCGWFGPIQFDPAWLARPDGPAYFAIAGDGPPLWFRMDPEAGLEVPARGDVVRATGHFDDVASSSCRASPDPSIGAEGFDPESDLPDVAQLVLECRARFVVTEYEVTDHEDLGPCCGRPGDSAIG